MTYETWKRDIPHSVGPNGGYWLGVSPSGLVPQNHIGRQETTSERGPSLFTRNRKTRRRLQKSIDEGRRDAKANSRLALALIGSVDTGNSFRTLTTSYSDNSVHMEWNGAQTTPALVRHYSGKLFATNSNAASNHPLWVDAELPSDTEIHHMGTTMISIAAPLNPISHALEGVTELIRDTPRIPGSAVFRDRASSLPKKGADELLNWEFALKPFINDIKDTAKATIRHKAIIDHLQRDSGRLVRRRVAFPETRSVTVQDLGLARPQPIASSFYPWSTALVPLTLTTVTTKKFVFSGGFTYYFPKEIPGGLNLKRNAIIAHKLYGADLQAVWALTPWSWALDWVTNAKESINYLSSLAQYGQVLRYGYIQCETTSERTYTLATGTIPSIGRDLQQTFGSHRKVRLKATPFGFGLDPVKFTGEQWAIIAALGISQDWQRLRHG